jgi:hypothetical protein
MSEIEQLRKEVNELRERIAKLEAARAPMTPGAPQWFPLPAAPHPTFVQDAAKNFPPGTILC